jgi:hypothetical protein
MVSRSCRGRRAQQGRRRFSLRRVLSEQGLHTGGYLPFMIVWLASYPRSGNTLLRMVIHEVFGLPTHSIYRDSDITSSDPVVSRAVGHVSRPDMYEHFLKEAHESRDVHLVKTHLLPDDRGITSRVPTLSTAPAIYVIRDGRAATISYWHYLRDFAQRSISLQRLIGSRVGWADHVMAWRPQARPRTLLVRFEGLAAGDDRITRALADFLGRAPKGSVSLSFADLQRRNARFFRVGSDAKGIADLERLASRAFWLRNGAAMVSHGYAEVDSFRVVPRPIRRPAAIARGLIPIYASFLDASACRCDRAHDRAVAARR